MIPNYLFPIIILIMVVCYAMSPDDLSHGVYVPLAYFVLHRLMIALKYASMSQEEYERAVPPRPLREGELDTVIAYNTQAQLITGLLGQNKELMEFQLAAAAAELGLDLPKMYINVPKKSWRCEHDDEDVTSVATWEVFIKDGLSELFRGDKAVHPDGGQRQFELNPDFTDIRTEMKKLDQQSKSTRDFVMIPIGLLAMALLGRCAKTYMKIAMTAHRCALAVLFLGIAQPFFLLRATPVSTDGWTVAYFVLSTFMNIVLGWVVTMFLTGTLYDALRKRSLSLKLNDMIVPNAKSFTHNLNVIKFLYDRGNGDVDFVFRENFQSKKVERELEVMLSEVEREDSNDGEEHGACRGNVDEADVFEVPQKPPMPTMLVNSNNILAYLALRQIMQVYGKRFIARLDTFVAFLAQLIVVLMLVCVVALANTNDSQAILDSALFRQAIIGMLTFAFAVILVVLVGGFANEGFNQHRESLAAHQFRVHNRQVTASNHAKRFAGLQKVLEKRLDGFLKHLCADQQAELIALEAIEVARHADSATPPPFGGAEDMASRTASRTGSSRPRRQSLDSDDDDDDEEAFEEAPAADCPYAERVKAVMRMRRDIPRLEKRVAMMEARVAEDEDLLNVLSYVADSIDMGNEFHPIKFMGMTCTLELAYSLFTTVLSFFGYMAATLMGAQDAEF